MTGKLYIVATPIGNLSDISTRAIETLRSVSLILCEDTRVTAKLKLAHSIETPTKSCFEHNEERRIPEALGILAAGQSLALVSDAGTPTINDPGFRLVDACRNALIEIVTIPGPCAFVAALAVSGFPTDRFEYAGFLPIKSGKRERELKEALGKSHTMIWYESPHRIVKTLETLAGLNPSAEVFVARELTKKHEECLRGKVADIIPNLRDRPGGPKGEFVLLLRGRGKHKAHRVTER